MATIAKAPGSCELNKQLNRDWAVQIKLPGQGAEDWIFVRGLDSVSVNIETSAVDSSDIDSDGWESQEKTSRKLTIELKGKYSRILNQTALEPSVQMLYDTGIELGAAGKLDVRAWRTDGTDEGWECTATNMFSSEGGDANALRGFTASMQSSCAPSRIKPVEVGGEKKASVYHDPAKAAVATVSKTVTLPSGVSGGTFTLSVGGETTSGLNHNASASTVQSALNGLSTVTDAKVTGTATAGYKVEYTGPDSLTADGSSLTGGASTTVTVA